MQTIIAATLAAILLIALGCRDLFVRKMSRGFTRIFQVSMWTVAALLFILIWTNPEHGATDSQILNFRAR